MNELRTFATRQRIAEVARSPLVGYISAVVLPLAVILVVERLRLPAFVFEHAIVLLVVACAVPWGVGPALLAAVVAVTGDNVVLREPIGLPTISGVREVVDLALFIAVAATVGWLVASARHQQMRAERAAERERQAREYRDRLIAMISHDLATPLNTIRGSIQFAQRFGAEAEVDLARLLERLDTAASRASSLVETLRDAQALERGELSLTLVPADVREIVRPIVQMFDHMSERHPVMMNVPSLPVMVNADGNRLQRVFENLLTNAIKYSPSGGVVEVCLEIERGEAVVSVRDHGIGISEESLPHIFKPSFRAPEAVAAAPGLGLGLTIATEIAHRHGGVIEVRRADPEGSIVSLRLPLCAREAVNARRSSPGPAVTGPSS
jgi:signal transduction histidine kinase